MSSAEPPHVEASVRRRRPRLATAEIRERMLRAAKEIVEAQGVTISLEEVAMDDVVHRAGVPRSAAYRAWPYKGDFVSALLTDFAGPNWLGTAGFDPETLLIVATVVLQHWDRLATVEGRRAVVQEAVRLALGKNMASITNSVEWEVYIALVATTRGNSHDETRQHLAAKIERAESKFIDDMAGFYAGICHTVGLRLRDPAITFRHLAIAGASAVEGLALRKIVAKASPNADRTASCWSLGEILDKPLPGPAIDGGTADWTLAAWIFQGLLDGVTEPIPEWQPTNEGRAQVAEIHLQTRLNLNLDTALST